MDEKDNTTGHEKWSPIAVLDTIEGEMAKVALLHGGARPLVYTDRSLHSTPLASGIPLKILIPKVVGPLWHVDEKKSLVENLRSGNTKSPANLDVYCSLDTLEL